MKTKADILNQMDEVIQYFINHPDNQPNTHHCRNVDRLINLKADFANGDDTENEASINYDGLLATGLTNEQILDEAARRKANIALQYEDYSLETWTVATKLLPHRKAYLLDDGSIRKFRIEYEM